MPLKRLKFHACVLTKLTVLSLPMLDFQLHECVLTSQRATNDPNHESILIAKKRLMLQYRLFGVEQKSKI